MAWIFSEIQLQWSIVWWYGIRKNHLDIDGAIEWDIQRKEEQRDWEDENSDCMSIITHWSLAEWNQLVLWFKSNQSIDYQEWHLN